MRKETGVFQQSVNSGIKHSFTLVVADREEKGCSAERSSRDRLPINIEATKIPLELKSHTPLSYIARHSFSNYYEIISAEFVQNIATEFPKWFKNLEYSDWEERENIAAMLLAEFDLSLVSTRYHGAKLMPRNKET